ncbi:MAG: pantetheine-phosphate adenylyltransferase [Defluviitaleaceae bacterium]|nr:pantetheine-phosphate adenylyltransferase [Defluviitaleaceae bacterium]
MTLIYPGSFDPVTMGHIDIALRGAELAGRLVVAVLDNPNKKTLFTVGERVALLKEAFAGNGKIEIDSFGGLLAEYAAKCVGKTAILRGLRSPADFESEARYAACNKLLGIETLFLAASPSLAFVSSSIVREIAAMGGDKNMDKMENLMVTPAVRAALAIKQKGEGVK